MWGNAITVVSLPTMDIGKWCGPHKFCSNQCRKSGHLLPQPKQLWGSNTASWFWNS